MPWTLDRVPPETVSRVTTQRGARVKLGLLFSAAKASWSADGQGGGSGHASKRRVERLLAARQQVVASSPHPRSTVLVCLRYTTSDSTVTAVHYSHSRRKLEPWRVYHGHAVELSR